MTYIVKTPEADAQQQAEHAERQRALLATADLRPEQFVALEGVTNEDADHIIVWTRENIVGQKSPARFAFGLTSLIENADGTVEYIFRMAEDPRY